MPDELDGAGPGEKPAAGGKEAQYKKEERRADSRGLRHHVIKRRTLRQFVLVVALFASIFVATRFFNNLFFDGASYVLYLYMAEVAVLGFVLTRIIAQLAYLILRNTSRTQAKTSRSIISISGYLVVVAIMVAMLAPDPTVTIAISTVTGIVLGISAQSLIGNAIAGMVLAVSRPFRIGDTIKAFDSVGVVEDIGLVHTRVITGDGNMLIVPNSAWLTNAVLKIFASGTARHSDGAQAA